MDKKIAILSGKGGTGKTLISVNLAVTAKNSVYIDCDVEEPNGYLFFNPKVNGTEKITVKKPIIDFKKCDGCRKCIDFCKFNALAYINEKVVVFSEVCHSCGGCVYVCPKNAISENEKVIGEIQKGSFGSVLVNTGILNVGEVSGVPIINQLLENSKTDKNITFIDCPPGSACIVMESIKDADYCILVGEPTVFGLHNLKMVKELVEIFKKKYGVVVNKYIENENLIDEYCENENIKVIGKIPYDQELGNVNSVGGIVSLEIQKYKELFNSIYENILYEIRGEE